MVSAMYVISSSSPMAKSIRDANLPRRSYKQSIALPGQSSSTRHSRQVFFVIWLNFCPDWAAACSLSSKGFATYFPSFALTSPIQGFSDLTRLNQSRLH
jgi:hypothetical protein